MYVTQCTHTHAVCVTQCTHARLARDHSWSTLWKLPVWEDGSGWHCKENQVSCAFKCRHVGLSVRLSVCLSVCLCDCGTHYLVACVALCCLYKEGPCKMSQMMMLLIDWLIYLLIYWLTDWLIDWLMDAVSVASSAEVHLVCMRRMRSWLRRRRNWWRKMRRLNVSSALRCLLQQFLINDYKTVHHFKHLFCVYYKHPVNNNNNNNNNNNSHSLTAALDQLRVVASSMSNDLGSTNSSTTVGAAQILVE